MQVRTSELNEIQLDWIVATFEGIKLTTGEGWQYVYSKETGNLYSPSRDWGHGGPIIERERIDVYFERDLLWIGSPQRGIEYRGRTPLIAAMRCYVASKLGEVVEIPDDLFAISK